MTWLIEVSDYSIPLQWFNHVPVDMIKFYFSYIDITFFFLPKTSKQVFHCRTQNAEFTRNRGTQRDDSWKPLKHSIVKRILVFKR